MKEQGYALYDAAYGGAGMSARKNYARNFYPGDCRSQIDHFLSGYVVPDKPINIVAGIVPHAGWVFSGAVAARVFKCISMKTAPETIILLGAVHSWRVRGNAVYGRGSWDTPLGEVEIDEEFAAKLTSIAGGDIVEDPSAHDGEHSIEVQVPFVKYLCPGARIVPVAVPPSGNAPLTGRLIGETALSLGRKAVVVGSTDLTHYGDNYGFTPYGYGKNAKEMMKKNDMRVIDLSLGMKYAEIDGETRAHQNACGPGALAAAVAAAETMGADRGYLLQYTTSYDVMPEGEFRMAVGYAGIVY